MPQPQDHTDTTCAMISKLRSSVTTAMHCWYRRYGLDVRDLFMGPDFPRFDTARVMKDVVHVPSMPSALYELKQSDTEAAFKLGRMCCSE